MTSFAEKLAAAQNQRQMDEEAWQALGKRNSQKNHEYLARLKQQKTDALREESQRPGKIAELLRQTGLITRLEATQAVLHRDPKVKNVDLLVSQDQSVLRLVWGDTYKVVKVKGEQTLQAVYGGLLDTNARLAYDEIEVLVDPNSVSSPIKINGAYVQYEQLSDSTFLDDLIIKGLLNPRHVDWSQEEERRKHEFRPRPPV